MQGISWSGHCKHDPSGNGYDIVLYLYNKKVISWGWGECCEGRRAWFWLSGPVCWCKSGVTPLWPIELNQFTSSLAFTLSQIPRLLAEWSATQGDQGKAECGHQGDIFRLINQVWFFPPFFNFTGDGQGCKGNVCLRFEAKTRVIVSIKSCYFEVVYLLEEWGAFGNRASGFPRETLMSWPFSHLRDTFLGPDLARC